MNDAVSLLLTKNIEYEKKCNVERGDTFFKKSLVPMKIKSLFSFSYAKKNYLKYLQVNEENIMIYCFQFDNKNSKPISII